MQLITDDTIIYILSNQEQIKYRLRQRQQKLNQLQQETKENFEKFFAHSLIKESVSWDGKISEPLSPAVWLRESGTIIEQFSCLYRVLFCYEALPEEWHRLLERLYIQHEKWDCIPMSSSQISRLRRKALNQIYAWYTSDLTEDEIIHLGTLQSLNNPKRKNR